MTRHLCTAECTDVLQAHYQPMQEAARRLPRLWQLHGQLQLAAALQGTKQAPAMAHLSNPVSSGQPPAFTPPSGHTAVPLDRAYTLQGEHTFSLASSSFTSGKSIIHNLG